MDLVSDKHHLLLSRVFLLLKVVSTFCVMNSQAWGKRSILSRALESASSGRFALWTLAPAKGLSSLRCEYSRRRQCDVCYQPHLPTNILSLTLSGHGVNTFRLGYCWNNGWPSVLMLALKPRGFLHSEKRTNVSLRRIFSPVCPIVPVVGSTGKNSIAFWLVDIQLSITPLSMHGCVKIVTLSCRIPTLLLYMGAIPHNSALDHNSFFSSQFLIQLQPKKTLFWIHFSAWKLLLFKTYFLLFCVLCCLLLRIQSLCQKMHLGIVFALTVEWFRYFFGLWLHYSCHHKGTETFQTCCFLPSLCRVSCYFEKRGWGKEWHDWGRKDLGQWTEERFFPFFF